MYASKTEVSPEKTRAEIEATLRRYGADSFASGWDAGRAYILFRAKERFVRFTVQLPDPKARIFTHTDRGKARVVSAAAGEYEQAVRATWRRLLLCIRAKLESVESGIESFEESFAAQIVLPDNTTVADWLKPQLEAAYATGEMPRGLLALPETRL